MSTYIRGVRLVYKYELYATLPPSAPVHTRNASLVRRTDKEKNNKTIHALVFILKQRNGEEY